MFQIEYDQAEMAYLFGYKVEGRWEVIRVPLLEWLGRSEEEVLSDVANRFAELLDGTDVVDVDYYLERPALPGPSLL